MLSSLFSKKEKVELPWTHLNQIDQLNKVDEASYKKPVLLFKHSTRCSISAMTLSRFERSFQEEAAFEPYFLDLIAHRDISNEIASKYGIKHESPQAILIKDGKVIFHESHTAINFDELNSIAQRS
ncbi:bacillithiol system redox-active protein YtxJ [Ekhidna sp.]|uniref:bacillithiol system redox-active protein YtxJ n=1 Tax=Ekhidna sp. TaxID=2608089 RepID=UPI003517F576